jgi:hypothetical protein
MAPRCVDCEACTTEARLYLAKCVAVSWAWRPELEDALATGVH